ncbi:MAG: Spy/CpxP family protein refolding chaperone [Pseudomonadota bacterium]
MSTNIPNEDGKQANKSRDRRRAIALVAGGLALVGATFSVQAIAENKFVQHAIVEAQERNPFAQKASWGGRDRLFGRERVRFSQMSDEQVEKRVNRMVRHISIEIDATKEQEDKITALIAAVAKDMRPVRNAWRSVGLEMLDTLSAKTVDREKLEALRAARIADANARSKQVVTALADVANVLTEAQRATLKERIATMRRWRDRRYR